MTNTLGEFFYSVDLSDEGSAWITLASGWISEAGGNAFRYTRDGTKHQLSGQLKYTGSTVASQSRQTGTIVNFSSFATFANPLGTVGDNFLTIGTGIGLRWLLTTSGALIIYRPVNATWALTQNDVFPINMHWLAPPGDPFYGLGPSSPV